MAISLSWLVLMRSRKKVSEKSKKFKNRSVVFCSGWRVRRFEVMGDSTRALREVLATADREKQINVSPEHLESQDLHSDSYVSQILPFLTFATKFWRLILSKCYLVGSLYCVFLNGQQVLPGVNTKLYNRQPCLRHRFVRNYVLQGGYGYVSPK